MLPVFLSRICLLLVTIAVPWGAAVGQGVPSNYVPLDRNESFVTDPRPVDVPSASELYQQSDTQESESETLAQDEPLASVTATSSGIAPPDGAIVALGSDPRHPQVMRGMQRLGPRPKTWQSQRRRWRRLDAGWEFDARPRLAASSGG